MHHASEMINEYSGKSLLMIGPGQSTSMVDMSTAIKNVDYTCCLNDVILTYLTDFYFAAEKFIIDYVNSNIDKKEFNKVIKVFLCNKSSHKTKIDLDFYKVHSRKISNCFYITEREQMKKTEYTLPSPDGFTKGNLEILGNLQNRFPKNMRDYIKSRTLGNSLQVLYGMGFSRLFLVGFMDSCTYDRLNTKHRNGYIDLAKKMNPDITTHLEPKQTINSMKYQIQIISTIANMYMTKNKGLYTLCPQDKNMLKKVPVCSVNDMRIV